MRVLMLGFAVVLGCSQALAGPSPVRVLKEIRASDHDQVILEFDRSMEGVKIRTEFSEDSIQLQIPDSSVFPAKIVALNGEKLARIFAYQYAPKWMRVRINVKGTASSLKSLLEVRPSGRNLIIRARVAAPVVSEKTAVEPEVVAESQLAPVKAEKKAESDRKTVVEKKNVSLTGNPTKDVNPVRKSGVALMILLPVLFMAWAFRRAKGKSQAWKSKTQKRGVELALGKMFGKKDRLIEVLDTQFFDPKRGIAVVRVRGREMVLGIADGTIQLLSEEESEQPQSTAAPEKSFESLLHSDVAAGPAVLSGAGMKESVRDRIRSRTRELKVW